MLKAFLVPVLALLAPITALAAPPAESDPILELGIPQAQEVACRVVIPIVTPDAVTIPINQKIDINLFANDSGTSLGLAYVRSGAHGTVRVLSGGTVTYSPNVGYTGPDTFEYGVRACLQCFSGFCSEPDIVDGLVTITITN